MRWIACSTVGIALLGCGGDGGGGTQPPTPVPTTVSIAVSGGASTMTAAGQTRTLTATVRDQNNQVMTGVVVNWESSATDVVTVSPATGATTTATAVAAGNATITASAGSVDDDQALTVEIGGGGPFPNTEQVTANTANQFVPEDVDIADGGSVAWTFEAQHNVTFATATGAPSDIGNQSTGTVSRTFDTPGTFNYQCTLHGGMNGSVTVH